MPNESGFLLAQGGDSITIHDPIDVERRILDRLPFASVKTVWV